MKFPQITIKDIARELGISPSTVSRALKDHPDISRDTKKAVNELAEKLNYQPNIVALNLRTKKTNTIGVVMPELVHFFFSTVISGIEDVAYEAGYNVILAQSNESIEREKSDLKALFNSRVDGMLISISRETTQYDHIESILAKGMPIVFYDRMYPNSITSNVIVDDYVGSKEAVNHLISQGCKKIAHLQASPNLKIAEDRLRGHLDALAEHQLSFPNEYLEQCPSGSMEDGFRAMNNLLALKNRPDSIFANNDVLAMGAMSAIKKAGLSIPKDIAIVGFSNWFYSSMLEPSLSSVDQPGFLMGQEAARLLLKQIDIKLKDEDAEIIPETKVLKTKLIIRESSLKKGRP
jgi:LacI family transcriptional regulator